MAASSKQSAPLILRTPFFTRSTRVFPRTNCFLCLTPVRVHSCSSSSLYLLEVTTDRPRRLAASSEYGDYHDWTITKVGIPTRGSRVQCIRRVCAFGRSLLTRSQLFSVDEMLAMQGFSY